MTQDPVNLKAPTASLKMQFDTTVRIIRVIWPLKSMDYVQLTTGTIEVMYSYNGITRTVSY